MEKLDEQHKAVSDLMSNLGQSGAMVHRIDAGIAKLQEIAKGNQLPTRQNDNC
jgi:N-glycosylase/DNA lyase